MATFEKDYKQRLMMQMMGKKSSRKIIAVALILILAVGGFLYYKMFVQFLQGSAGKRFDINREYNVAPQEEGYDAIWQYFEEENQWYLYVDKCIGPSTLQITWYEFYKVTGHAPQCFNWISL